MFEKFKKKEILYPTVIMLAICLVVTAALAGTNLLTKEKIADINSKNEAAAMSRVLKADTYKEAVFESTTYSEAQSDGKLVGYVFKMNENGYGGTVSVMVGIKADGTVNKVEVLDVTSETPGLGQNTAKDDFIKQFTKKSNEVKAVKFGTKSGEDEIDAVASATITSKAVTKCVNKAIKTANELLKDGDAK